MRLGMILPAVEPDGGPLTSGGLAEGARRLERFSRLEGGLGRFRALGGGRAVVTNLEVDLSAPAAPSDDEGPFTLRCPPEEAAARLRRLADLGFDDAVLFSLDHRDESLAALRALL